VRPCGKAPSAGAGDEIIGDLSGAAGTCCAGERKYCSEQRSVLQSSTVKGVNEAYDAYCRGVCVCVCGLGCVWVWVEECPYVCLGMNR
jgi:hypothetical protein